MATAIPTVAVSLVYVLWDACRRTRRRTASPRPAPEPPGGDQRVERRLDCLTVLAKPNLRHGR